MTLPELLTRRRPSYKQLQLNLCSTPAVDEVSEQSEEHDSMQVELYKQLLQIQKTLDQPARVSNDAMRKSLAQMRQFYTADPPPPPPLIPPVKPVRQSSLQQDKDLDHDDTLSDTNNSDRIKKFRPTPEFLKQFYQKSNQVNPSVMQYVEYILLDMPRNVMQLSVDASQMEIQSFNDFLNLRKEIEIHTHRAAVLQGNLAKDKRNPHGIIALKNLWKLTAAYDPRVATELVKSLSCENELLDELWKVTHRINKCTCIQLEHNTAVLYLECLRYQQECSVAHKKAQFAETRLDEIKSYFCGKTEISGVQELMNAQEQLADSGATNERLRAKCSVLSKELERVKEQMYEHTCPTQLTNTVQETPDAAQLALQKHARRLEAENEALQLNLALLNMQNRTIDSYSQRSTPEQPTLSEPPSMTEDTTQTATEQEYAALMEEHASAMNKIQILKETIYHLECANESLLNEHEAYLSRQDVVTHEISVGNDIVNTVNAETDTEEFDVDALNDRLAQAQEMIGALSERNDAIMAENATLKEKMVEFDKYSRLAKVSILIQQGLQNDLDSVQGKLEIAKKSSSTLRTEYQVLKDHWKILREILMNKRADVSGAELVDFPEIRNEILRLQNDAESEKSGLYSELQEANEREEALRLELLTSISEKIDAEKERDALRSLVEVFNSQ